MHLTTNTRPFVESEVYSSYVLKNLHDGMLPEMMYRNVTDFASGDTLHIKTIGTVTIQEAAEDTELVYSPIETGEITFRITDYVGDAWYITDDLREDGTQIDTLLAERASEGTRALQETIESRYLRTAVDALSESDPYLVNKFPHKLVSSEPNGLFALDHLIQMRLSFNKANVPAEGRVFICDGIVEATLNSLVTVTHDVTEYGREILENGMARGQRFVNTLYGWDIITSNRLPTGEYSDGTTTIEDGVANIFMCVADDQTKPVMFAWRRAPKSEGERNKDRARDEHVMRARFGFGIQRIDTIGLLVTSATNYK